jgi:GNAT superfamily N-acetyltransferase/ADP-ribose pyrophosphatase YjhB (NUDIX family)
VPGGRRESNESILETAKRELYEETGAIKFDIVPVCIYSVKKDIETFGMLYFAKIIELGVLPESEIEAIDFFDNIPDELSFPLIQPLLTNRVKDFLHLRNNKLLIRPANINDAEGIQKINKLALGYDFSLSDTTAMLSKILSKSNDIIFVVEDKDIIAGYAHGSDYDCTYMLPLKNIMAMGVLEEYRGNGIGRLLLSAIEDWARNDGCSGVRLISSLYRTEAHEFYLRCDYFNRKDQKNFMKLF